MVVGKSLEWLPPGFTEKVKYKNGRKIKYYCNVATGAKYHSKKDVLRCATEDNGLLGTPRTTNGDDNRLSSNSKVDARLLKTNDSPKWLPDGWIMEERTRQSGTRRGSIYKVYTDVSSGSRFYSRAAVTRYLDTVDHANTMTVQNKLDNVDEPFPDMSPQCLSMTNTGSIPEEKKKGNSFKTVATVSTAADDLPPGWIKEIKTSKSGNRIRKDPYYTDPVSGYVFRSKLDALRYLKTNDIGSCACRPKKRELDDLNLITNDIPSSNPAHEKLSGHKRQLFLGGELNGVGESSGTKSLAESEAKILKQTQDNNESDSVKVTSVGADCLEEKISCGNSYKNTETENNPEPENEVSEKDPRVMAVNVAICSPITDPLTKQQLSEQTDRTQVDLKKSKKRRNLSLPSRTSKRLAGCEPEMPSNLVLNERSLRAATRRSSGSEVDTSPSFSLKASASIPLPSDIEPAKEAAEHTFIGEETLQEIEPLIEVEKPPTEVSAIPESQAGGKASEKQLDDGKRSHESQLCYDFGDSWSDPLEFALKTLRGKYQLRIPWHFRVALMSILAFLTTIRQMDA
ncbi:hypothetical protein Pfo_010346 [Paulownia fortunei]|nr:hypothetical protein Pfo_010346 [Paulownia fortunei]